MMAVGDHCVFCQVIRKAAEESLIKEYGRHDWDRMQKKVRDDLLRGRVRDATERLTLLLYGNPGY